MTGAGPQHILNVLKYIHTYLNKSTAYDLFQVESWRDKDDFEDIWHAFQESPFHGMCALDHINLERLFDWAINVAGVERCPHCNGVINNPNTDDPCVCAAAEALLKAFPSLTH